MTSVDRNDTNPAGDTVADLLSVVAGDLIVDEDFSSVEGIAIVGVDNSNGTWEYSTDGGVTWISLAAEGVANGAVDETNAVLLDGRGQLRFVPDAGYFGPAGEVTFKAWDQTDIFASGSTNVDASFAGENGAYSRDTASVGLDVLLANDAPVIGVLVGNDVDENASNGSLIGVVGANDPNMDNVTFTLEDDASDRFSIDSISGAITVDNGGLLDFETNEVHQITVLATDEFGMFDRRTFVITVVDVNEAPDTQDIRQSVFQGTEITGDIASVSSDPEGDDLTYRIISQPRNGTIELNEDGTWTYLHDDTENFNDSIEFVVEDSAGNEVTGSILLNVIPAAEPVTTEDSFQTSPTEILTLTSGETDILGNDIDVDENAVIEILSQPENGQVVVQEDGSLVYIPDVSFSGDDVFEYRVVNENGRVSQATSVRIEVEAILPPPASQPVDVTNNDQSEAENDVEEETTTTDDELDNEILEGRMIENGSDSSQDTSVNDVDPTAISTDGLADDFEADSAEAEQDTLDQANENLRFQFSRLASSNFASNDIGEFGITISDFQEYSEETIALAVNFFKDLDNATNHFEHSLGVNNQTFVTAAASGIFTVGIVGWMIQAGALSSIFMTALPAWQSFDPLPIIESGIGGKSGDDEDTLEDLVDSDSM